MNQDEIRKKVSKKYLLVFSALCALEGWQDTAMVPGGIMKEAERIEPEFTNSIISLIQPLIDQAREEGKREVVTWIRDNCPDEWGPWQAWLVWQAKLQEWFPTEQEEK